MKRNRRLHGYRLLVPAILMTGLVGTLEVMAQASGTGGDEEGRLSMLRLIIKGGPVMIPLGIGSVIAVAIAAERFLSLRHDKVVPPGSRSPFRCCWCTST